MAQVVVIDPHAGYRKAIGDSLPLADKVVTEVGPRITCDHRGRRSTKRIGSRPTGTGCRELTNGLIRPNPADVERPW